jgi:hypothetical protein
MSGAAAAAAAAAAERRRREQEEEEMTTYPPGDDWEFKIVRANSNVFRNPRNLNRLLEEESVAGWSLVEKFDNQRIRLKRPRQARLNDSRLPPGVDPYRVHYGLSPVAFALLVMIIALALAAGVVGLIFQLVNTAIH